MYSKNYLKKSLKKTLLSALYYPDDIYQLKVNNRNTRPRCEIF